MEINVGKIKDLNFVLGKDRLEYFLSGEKRCSVQEQRDFLVQVEQSLKASGQLQHNLNGELNVAIYLDAGGIDAGSDVTAVQKLVRPRLQ